MNRQGGKSIEVVRDGQLRRGDFTRGIKRERAFEGGEILFARSRILPDAKSGWHHHGAREVYGFLVSGTLRLEYGEGGKEAAEIGPGDFFHIPVGLVHRDVNPDPGQEATVVNVFLGKGPTVVNVPGP